MNIKLKLIIGIAFIPLAIYLWPSALGGDTQFMLVQGQSMLPTIEPGSFVILKAQEKYEIGDIVGYSTPDKGPFSGRNVVHRITQENSQGFIIKGDNNPKRDPGIVSRDQIIGEVIFFTPFAGYLLLFMRNPLVMVVLAAAAFMMQLKKKKKKNPLEKIQIDKKSKKKKNKNYVLFVPALLITISVYFVIQVSFEAGIDKPSADPFTTFLFGITDVYMASTTSFAMYFLLMMGLYLIAKNYDTIPRKILPSGNVLTLKKKTNSPLVFARMIWLSFILSGIYFLYLMLQDLQTQL